MTTKTDILLDIIQLIVEVHDVARTMEEFNIPMSLKLRHIAHELTLIEKSIRFEEV